MKYFALNIGGNPVPFPNEIKDVSNISLNQLIVFATQTILVVGIILSVIFLIISGIQWITSGGSKEGIQKARARITYSIIGLIIILLSFFIVTFIGGLFGVELIRR